MKRAYYIKSVICWSILIISFISPAIGQGQESRIDSLEQLIEKNPIDSIKVELWSEIAQITAPIDRIKNEKVLLTIIEFCESKIAEEKETSKALYFEQQLAYSYTALGVNYFMNANFSIAIQTLRNSIQLSKPIKAYSNLARSYTVIGVIHKNLKDFEASNEALNLAVIYSDSAENNNSKALAYNNIAINNLEQDSIEQAIFYFEKTKQLYAIEKNDRGVSVALTNLGSSYKTQEKYDKAISMFQQSIALREQIKDKQGLIFSYHRLGDTYLTTNKIKLAREQAEKSLQFALEKGYPRGLRDANELLFLIHKKENNSSKALYHYEQYIAARDSLVNEENIREITRLEEQHIYAQKAIKDSIINEEKIRTVQLELEVERTNAEKQTIITVSLGFILLLILILVGFIYSQYKKTNRQKNLIQQQKIQVDESLKELSIRNEEKEILLKEIHHRVKNNLQVVSGLLELQSFSIDNPEFTSAVEDGKNRIHSMAMIHEMLYQNKNVGELNFDEYISELIDKITQSYVGSKKLQSQLHIDQQLNFDLDTAIPLGLIITELYSNALKYGIEETQKGSISVKIEKTDDQNCLLTVKDNGKGLPKDFEIDHSKSLGLRLIKMLSIQINGQIKYSYDNGALFTLIFQPNFSH